MAKVFDIKENNQVAYKSGAVLGHKINSQGVYGAIEGTFTRASTATRVNSSGLIEDVASGVPQVDFEGGVSHYKLEPQRRNILDYSESISSWGNNIGSPTITDNVAVSPDGTTNASSITGLSASAASDISSIVVSVSAELTFSVYLKNVDATSNGITIRNTATDASCIINWSGSVLSSITNNTGTFYFEDFGNGWYRVYCSYLAADTVQRPRIVINQDNTTIYAWGVMIEDNGSGTGATYPTSYIPTSGATATRIASSLNGFGNEFVLPSSEGTMFIEISALANDLSERYITMSDGTNTNVVRVGFFATSNYILFQVNASGLQTNQSSTSYDITISNKIAVTFKTNEFKMYINGSLADTIDTSGTTFSANTLNTLQLANGTGSAQPFYGNLKQLQVYDTALSDAELQTLTT